MDKSLWYISSRIFRRNEFDIGWYVIFRRSVFYPRFPWSIYHSDIGAESLKEETGLSSNQEEDYVKRMMLISPESHSLNIIDQRNSNSGARLKFPSIFGCYWLMNLELHKQFCVRLEHSVGSGCFCFLFLFLPLFISQRQSKTSFFVLPSLYNRRKK